MEKLKMKPDISIVMPVYNTGEYLKESIQGILNQSFNNFELICVDDCSNDLNTLEILDNYSSIDRRVTVYHLEKNGGAAEARNYGLEKAKGKYIQFIDSDDVFSENMLEEMYSAIRDADADICVCSHKTFKDGNIEEGEVSRPKRVEGLTDRSFSVHDTGEDGLCWWWDVPWNKLVKRDLITENDIKFQNLSSCNDGYYANIVVLLANRIVYTETREPLVYYRVNNPKQITAKNDIINFYLFMKKVLDSRWNIADLRERVQLLYVLSECGRYLIKQPGDCKKKKELIQYIKKELIRRYDESTVGGCSFKLQEHIRSYIEGGTELFIGGEEDGGE